jgi:hypothetical protein
MTVPAQPAQQPGMMGFGVQPQQSPEQWQLAAALAQMNDSELTKELMTTGQPQGRMVGDRFVPPSWTESLAGVAKQGLGAMSYKQNMDMKKQFMQAMQANALGRGGANLHPMELMGATGPKVGAEGWTG